MNNWTTTLDLQDIFYKRNGECGAEDWTDKTVHELAKEIARRIERKWPTKLEGIDRDPQLEEIHDLFKGVSTLPQHTQRMEELLYDDSVTDEEAEYFSSLTPIMEFNEVMNMLYDWSDKNRVWVNK